MADDERSALLDRIETDLAGVEQALARLDAGSYFACEVCGAALADEALVADPMASRCPSCAAAAPSPASPDTNAVAPADDSAADADGRADAADPAADAAGPADFDADADTTAHAD